MLLRTLVAALAIPLVCAGCGGTKNVTADPVVVTVTASASSVPAPTVTVTTTTTATVTASVTATESVTQQAAGPIDVTPEYAEHARSAHMSQEQQRSIVQAWLDGGVLNVLTDMRPDWGGWACDWEPATLAGERVRFARILYDDGSLFRICH